MHGGVLHHEIAAALCIISSSHFFAKFIPSKCDDGILNICAKTRLHIHIYHDGADFAAAAAIIILARQN